jgi:hypothetical protein
VHDPLVVAFEIRRPWPKRDSWKTELAKRNGTRWQLRGPYFVVAGHGLYWPCMVTVWHREPGGHDSLTVCGRRTQRPDGTWHQPRTWRFHVHHWRVQVIPFQKARRRLLTRCAECGGRSTKARPISIGTWGRERGPWWRGETGMRHMNCTTTSKEQNRG